MMAVKKQKPAPDDLVEVFDCEQRGEDWYALRLGLPTASVFGTIMATGQDGGPSLTRKRLLYLMAGEILSGKPMESFSSAAMKRGIDMEPAAIEHYEFVNGVDVQRVGFVRRTRETTFGTLTVGCSPDGLVGADGLLQVKTMQPDLICEMVDKGRFPTEHRAQCHGELWVTGRRWTDLKIFYDGMPVSPTFRINRDESYIAEIRSEVEKFDYELRQLVTRIKLRAKV